MDEWKSFTATICGRGPWLLGDRSKSDPNLPHIEAMEISKSWRVGISSLFQGMIKAIFPSNFNP
jgi:hypothetical protein|tara:strand:+ start:145 stop:336 length:192 start_codon:yes stop_codon:yes gene_type:complete